MVEITQARRNRSRYFVASVLVALVGVFAFLFFDGQFGRSSPQKLDSTIEVPKT